MEHNKVIVLPNDLTSSFFVNEVPYLKKFFDEIIIISFRGNTKEAQDIIKKYDLECIFISLHDLRLIHLKKIIKWFFSFSVRQEIKESVSLSKVGLQKLGYIFLYGLYNILTISQVKKQIDKTTLETQIYIYSYWLSRTAYCAASIKNIYPNRKLKAISRAHRYDLYEEQNKLNYLPFRKNIVDGLDAIYFISRDGYEYFQQKYGYIGIENIHRKLYLSYLGTYNDSRWTKKMHSKKQVTIASCSYMIDVKRLDLIIEFIYYLQLANINITWIHIGMGPLFEKIKLQASQCLVKDSFHFLGTVDNSLVLKKYIEYDVDFFVNLSDSEGIPVSIMEAMSLGIPVIARNVGGNSEIVNSNNGYLFESSDLKENGKEIIKFVSSRIDNIEYYTQISTSSKKTWENKFSARSNYNKFFESVLHE